MNVYNSTIQPGSKTYIFLVMCQILSGSEQSLVSVWFYGSSKWWYSKHLYV